MILCCGDALIDMIPSTDAAGAPCLVPHGGGAVFNTAIALGRLGIATGFLSGLSTDLFGELLIENLHASEVATTHVIISNRPTTLAFVKLNNGDATYTFYDENTAGRMLDPADLPRIPRDVTALYFGGISLINEPAAEFYRALAQHEAGKRVIVMDPNIRASFISDEPRYRKRLAQMIAVTDILKVSDEDLNWIVPGPLTPGEKAAILREQGPDILILTRGSEGATAYFGDDQTVDVPVKKVTVADTVGAGDTFNAGFLASLQSHGLLTLAGLKTLSAEHLTQALDYGTRVAAITVSRHGANPPWAQEVGA
ncbi:carbohydrate kinase family protein [Pararhodobacter oceanensis]|uniref:carbohydrate kinase family protein n=1 Tax=Pararhodobacter oceanensis TaxID=2172121 RepID=UPI003A8FBC39